MFLFIDAFLLTTKNDHQFQTSYRFLFCEANPILVNGYFRFVSLEDILEATA